MNRPLQELLVGAAILLLTGCGGGRSHNPSGPGTPAAGVPPSAGKVGLSFSAEQDGSQWRVDLKALNATDIYQIAGTLTYDPSRYDVVTLEAGGGLGDPLTSYFVHDENTPGNLDFGYTKRYWGPGKSGEVWLLSLRVTPRQSFRLRDFALATGKDSAGREQLLVRDSHKRALTPVIGGAQ